MGCRPVFSVSEQGFRVKSQNWFDIESQLAYVSFALSHIVSSGLLSSVDPHCDVGLSATEGFCNRVIIVCPEQGFTGWESE